MLPAASVRTWFVVVALALSSSKAWADSPFRALLGGGILYGGSDSTYLANTFQAIPIQRADAWGLGVGGYVRIGLQWSDYFGLETDLSALTLLVVSDARADAMLELTPTSHVTLAGGIVIGANFRTATGIYGDPGSQADFLGWTGRVDYHFPTARRANGVRSGGTVGLAFDIARTSGVSGLTYAAVALGPTYGLFLMTGYELAY